MTKYSSHHSEIMREHSVKLRRRKEFRLQIRPPVAEPFLLGTLHVSSYEIFLLDCPQMILFPKSEDESSFLNKYGWQTVHCQLACAN